MSVKPFDVLESSFQLLCAGPCPLSVPGEDLGAGFPDRVIPLVELRSMLLHPATSAAARDRALGVLVARAQAQGGGWMVGLGAVLLPGMRRMTGGLVRACPEVTEDLQADALAGLVEAVATFDVAGGRIAGRLVWQAAGRAKRHLAGELAASGRHSGEVSGREPQRPWGHPDLVLAEAAAAGVISRADANLIGDTRLGDVSLVEWAAERELSYPAVKMRRHRAERLLVAWIGRRDVVETVL